MNEKPRDGITRPLDKIVMCAGFPLLRHPSEYVLVVDSKGQMFRLAPKLPIPDGYEEVVKDKYRQPVYKTDGRLLEKYWCLKRLHIPFTGR